MLSLFFKFLNLCEWGVSIEVHVCVVKFHDRVIIIEAVSDRPLQYLEVRNILEHLEVTFAPAVVRPFEDLEMAIHGRKLADSFVPWTGVLGPATKPF